MRGSAISQVETPVAFDPKVDSAIDIDAALAPPDAASSAVVRRDMSPGERTVRLAGLILLLYVFLIGIDLLGAGIAGLGGGAADSLFRGVANPVVGLAVGVLATVLVQSSSVSTATIVALVGAGAVSVPDAVPMIMGANIGTTVTSTLASLGAIRRTDEFRRAFAGATVHDLFNVLAVVVLLPVELATGMLSRWASRPAASSTARSRGPSGPVPASSTAWPQRSAVAPRRRSS
jgi:hypothetical protein